MQAYFFAQLILASWVAVKYVAQCHYIFSPVSIRHAARRVFYCPVLKPLQTKIDDKNDYAARI
jgi:hypothetical protein